MQVPWYVISILTTLTLNRGVIGWSYGLNGNLAKAPRFDALSDFDKNEWPLFKVHTHIDRLGFIYVNFDNSPEPIPWESQFGEIDEQERLNIFTMSDYVFDHDWKMEGNFNWKALIENYNEVCCWLLKSQRD